MPHPHWGATTALVTALAAVLALGPSLLFWSGVGAVRRLVAVLGRLPVPAVGRRRAGQNGGPAGQRTVAPEPHEVAVLIAAHNEELVIERTLDSVPHEIPRSNIFVISDASTDSTAAAARASGCHVLELVPNRGKAGALAEGLRHFGIAGRFEVVLLLDADSRLSPDYLSSGLPLLADPGVAAVAGRARTLWHPESLTWKGRLLVAYRERLYVLFQVLVKHGQAARWANAVTIAPGFASMYRTSAMRDIDIAAPGLAIEDFNMTFEVHARRLGRVAFDPRAAVAYTQDPDTFGDYTRQVRRWALGFWQTARRHGLHVGRFWAALAVFTAEIVVSSLMFVAVGPGLLLSVTARALQELPGRHPGMLDTAAGLVPPWSVLIGVILPDVVLTLFVALAQRRREYLLMGPAFPLMRVVDAALCLQALWLSLTTKSAGTWSSPRRRKDGAGPGRPTMNAVATNALEVRDAPVAVPPERRPQGATGKTGRPTPEPKGTR